MIIECNSDEFQVVLQNYVKHSSVRIRQRIRQGGGSKRIVKNTIQNTITLYMDEWDVGINATVVKIKL